ncbi:MAG: EAL domain-containing protein [Lachnospiraceae bacterium]|nr:EAL domain-containing protein [Lachnospiraceae bacterium]
MFTWNFQYVSKTRIADTLKQLTLDSDKGDILIRIHTAFHPGNKAVELAAFIKELVPGAHILGTSTSAVISWGKLAHDQCVISVTQFSGGHLKTAMLPTFSHRSEDAIEPRVLCENVKNTVIDNDTRLLLAFTSRKYQAINEFVDACNKSFPGVQMAGGIACSSDMIDPDEDAYGFVFDENGWSNSSILLASFGGAKVESRSAFASGVQEAGKEMTITEADGNRIISLDGVSAAEVYRECVGEEIRKKPEIDGLFPFVYSDNVKVPYVVRYSEEGLYTSHNVVKGSKIKRAFIYDRKTVISNRAMFSQFEMFEKAETIFGYVSKDRLKTFPNIVKWELSTYDNSIMSGCVTDGEIIYDSTKNVFANCVLAISAIGENEVIQHYNPYVFLHTESLSTDNRRLLSYLMEVEEECDKSVDRTMNESFKAFVKDCELKLLRSENEELPNEAALNMDIKIGGYDRVCLIDVLDTSSMRTVFAPQKIDMTYKEYVSKCSAFASQHDYHLYVLDSWRIAIAAPSYMVSLQGFEDDMKQLHEELFETAADFIAIVPVFCVINECNVDNIRTVYNAARLEMLNRNIQFYVCEANEGMLDEESIREKYHMVNVINYALSHDKVIPYYQGIYDNKSGSIHHYESLMRLMDEDGKVYNPGSFLDVARNFGVLYDSLSLIMIKKVLKAFKKVADKSVSINISMRDIRNDELIKYVYGFLATAKYPNNFIFEILENEDVDDYESLVMFVDNIHRLGGKISIDDFGSGYSNLQHIASIHSDFIKIDGSIVRNCCNSTDSENLVALMSGWKKLSDRSVEIVAEYVENEDIQAKIMEYNIDYSQGYLFSKPSPDIDGM